MNNSEKPDSNEFKIELKGKLTSSNKSRVIHAIEASPKFSRYYHLQGNDWYELREKDNQDIANPPNIQVLLKDNYILVMRPVGDKSWWIDLEKLKEVIESEIQKVSVTIENYWE